MIIYSFKILENARVHGVFKRNGQICFHSMDKILLVLVFKHMGGLFHSGNIKNKRLPVLLQCVSGNTVDLLALFE